MKFDSETDEKAWTFALDGPDYQIGDVQTCQWDGMVVLSEQEAGEFGADSAGQAYVAALVTEDDRGFVWVDYFTSRKTASLVYLDLTHAHRDCCLYAADVAA